MSKRTELIKLLGNSIEDETLVKFVLSKPASNLEVIKVTTRLVQIKNKDNLSIVSSHKTKDVTKNHLVADGLRVLQKLLDTSFENAALLTTKGNYQLERTPNGKDIIHESAATAKCTPNKSHNHEKARLVPSDRPFLNAVGITDQNGEIKAKMKGKYNQVESFINILSNTVNESALKDAKEISLYDMGSGSGYVTFAIYDYATNSLNKKMKLTGVDINQPLTKRNNETASNLGFSGMNFVHSPIEELDSINADIVVALHACNTATDDSIYAGIQANAEVIVLSPCCHQELRKKIKAPEVLKPMLKFGTHEEHMAEMLTDTIRTLILEIKGYKTNLFEFVSSEHSGKNNIITAVKKQSNQDKNKFVKQLADLKEFYKLPNDLYLESLFDA